MLQNDPPNLPPFHFEADPDPAYHFEADAAPDPQHCLCLPVLLAHTWGIFGLENRSKQQISQTINNHNCLSFSLLFLYVSPACSLN
jgi:hypothetical protein